jgi:molybdate transport system substrate-binding protein
VVRQLSPRRLALSAVVLSGMLIASACGGDDPDGEASGAGDRNLVIFTASSLTEAFTELGTAFEIANPGTHVTFNFAGSSALATQINEGAPADVFASADAAQMKVVMDKQNAGESSVFARNTPVLVVPASGSPVRTFADLAKDNVKLVLAAREVPIGRYSREILAKASEPGGISSDFSARVLSNLKSDEANVRGVLTKVQLGEADAGIVYRTDVSAAVGEVTAIEIPARYNVVAEYLIAVIPGSENEAAAARFVEFVRSSDGMAILEKHGFAKP